MYAEKIASTMDEYKKSAEAAEHIQTPSSHTDMQSTSPSPLKTTEAKPSLSFPHEYSFQPNLLNALRDAKTYNEAYQEVVDPVGAIVPEKLMSIERPSYKRTGERRRYQKVFKLRIPKIRMFPR